ncbi:hypothetical protein [Mycolicibacterium phlei]|uniref:hypothetical protein n=1 Tax=Mycolicibacterium phlei TaxID=1771 RepID=UPI00188D0089|nr:hypothetical protein [Mycolicibacterium phlei]
MSKFSLVRDRSDAKGGTMQVAIRPFATTGIALAGASVIALSPVTVAPPDIGVPAPPIASATVGLAAATNPIAAWLQVASDAFANAAAIGEDWLSDPAPVLRQFIRNQLGYGQTLFATGQGVVDAFANYISPDNPIGLFAQLERAGEELESGNIAGTVRILGEALIGGPILNIGIGLLSAGLLEVPATMAQNFANVVATLTDVTTALPIVLGTLGPALGIINATGDSIQAVVDAVGGGDLLGAIGTVLSAPAVIVGALVNGYTNIEGTEYPGLLSYGDIFAGGLVQALLVTLPRAIANAITPPAEESAGVMTTVDDSTSEVSSTVSEPAATVTIDAKAVAAAVDADTDAAEVEAAAVNGDEGPDPAGAVAADESTESESTESEEATEPDLEAELGDDDAAEEDESGTANGGTDLSGGNKATPGDAGDDGESADDGPATGGAGGSESGDDDPDTGGSDDSGSGSDSGSEE